MEVDEETKTPVTKIKTPNKPALRKIRLKTSTYVSIQNDDNTVVYADNVCDCLFFAIKCPNGTFYGHFFRNDKPADVARLLEQYLERGTLNIDDIAAVCGNIAKSEKIFIPKKDTKITIDGHKKGTKKELQLSNIDFFLADNNGAYLYHNKKHIEAIRIDDISDCRRAEDRNKKQLGRAILPFLKPELQENFTLDAKELTDHDVFFDKLSFNEHLEEIQAMPTKQMFPHITLSESERGTSIFELKSNPQKNGEELQDALNAKLRDSLYIISLTDIEKKRKKVKKSVVTGK